MEINELQHVNQLMWLSNVKQFYQDRPMERIIQMQQHWEAYRADFQQLYKRYSIDLIQRELPKDTDPLPSNALLLTFHFGPYRLLPRYLIAMGYKISILAADKLIDREKTWYADALQKENLPQDQINWISATDPMVLRKILQSTQSERLMVVYIDANESTGIDNSTDHSRQWRVGFKDHYFYWRYNLVKLALRLGIPIYSAHMHPDGSGKWTMGKAQAITIGTGPEKEEALLKAMEKLQQVFYGMMSSQECAWENWAYIHLYNKESDAHLRRMTNAGSWVMPIAYREKIYLFDVFNQQFFEIIPKQVVIM